MKNKWLYEKYVAHRGLHDGDIKQNTIEAFKAAIDKGYNIEIDVQLTKDNIPVVFHDFYLGNLTDCKKNVTDISYEEIKNVRYIDSNSSIPLFKDVLSLCEGKTGLMIEIKKIDIETKIMDVEKVILPMLKQYKGDFIVKSFNPNSLEYFRKNAPIFTRGLLSSVKSILDYPQSIRSLVLDMICNTKKRIDFFDYNIDLINYIEILKQIKGEMPLIVWTVRSQESFDKTKNKVNNIIFENFLPN